MNLFNVRCVYCQRILVIAKHGLCSNCYRQIPHSPYCGRCGTSLKEYSSICGQCVKQPPLWDQLVVVSAYRPPLSDLIHRLKFQNQFWLDRTLARLLYLAIREARRTHGLILPDAILPVPLHHIRQWQRSYNQASLLASYLARTFNLPYYPHLIKRVKNTISQRGLTAKARQRNMKNAFEVSHDLQQKNYHRIALVDDVITTGSTLNEIVKCLHQQGIEHVQVWGLCKT